MRGGGERGSDQCVCGMERMLSLLCSYCTFRRRGENELVEEAVGALERCVLSLCVFLDPKLGEAYC